MLILKIEKKKTIIYIELIRRVHTKQSKEDDVASCWRIGNTQGGYRSTPHDTEGIAGSVQEGQTISDTTAE